MKVSVVIPAYNEEHYIATCLESIYQQTTAPDEVIVVDNNSTDYTTAIAQRYPVRVVTEKEQGMTPARNRGFNAAKYDLIVRTDADCKVPPDWIKRIKKLFNDKNVDAIAGLAYFYDLPMKSSNAHKLVMDSIATFLQGKEMLNGPNFAVTKKIWDLVKNDICLDDKMVHEDMDLAIHIHRAGGKIYRDNSLVVGSSGRRIVRKPVSMFIEYPYRTLKMMWIHLFDKPAPSGLSQAVVKQLKEYRRTLIEAYRGKF